MRVNNKYWIRLLPVNWVCLFIPLIARLRWSSINVSNSWLGQHPSPSIIPRTTRWTLRNICRQDNRSTISEFTLAYSHSPNKHCPSGTQTLIHLHTHTLTHIWITHEIHIHLSLIMLLCIDSMFVFVFVFPWVFSINNISQNTYSHFYLAQSTFDSPTFYTALMKTTHTLSFFSYTMFFLHSWDV